MKTTHFLQYTMYKASLAARRRLVPTARGPSPPPQHTYYKRSYKNLSGTNMYIHYKMYNIIILCIYNHNINLINNREK